MLDLNLRSFQICPFKTPAVKYGSVVLFEMFYYVIPISGQVDEVSATETVDSSSIHGESNQRP